MSNMIDFVEINSDLCRTEWFKSDLSVEMGRWKAQAFWESDALVYWVAEQTEDAESPIGKAWQAYGGEV